MKKSIKELTKQKIKELESTGLSLDQIFDSYEGTEEEKKGIKEWKEKELNKVQKNLEEQQKQQTFSHVDKEEIEKNKGMVLTDIDLPFGRVFWVTVQFFGAGLVLAIPLWIIFFLIVSK